MKLLLLDPPLGLARELRRREHRLVVTSNWRSPGLQELSGPAFDYVRLKGRKKLSPVAIQQLRKIIRDFQPELLHAFMPNSLAQALFACWGLKKKPVVVSFRGITRKPTSWDPADWITYLSPRVTFHACESNAVMQAMLEGGIQQQKCCVVYNCTESIYAAGGAAEIRQRYGIPTDAFVVGTVACIRPVKGIDYLVKAAAACASLANAHFLLVGECKDKLVEQLVLDPRLRNRLTMTGHLDNAQQVMQAFDLFVMPSRREGLCRALLEAMDQGICPIVSDAGGMKEMVRHGLEGEVVTSGNVEALQDAIVRLHDNPGLRITYGAAARLRVREICSPASFTDRLEALYQKLLAGKK